MLSNASLFIKWSSFSSKTNLKKAGYNKVIAKYTHCNKFYYIIENYLFLHLKKQKQVG